MSKPVELPRWGTALLNPSDIVDPTSGKKDIGWQDGEMPPHSYMNWLFNLIYQWCSYLNGLTGEALTWTALETFSAGIAVTGGATIDTLNLTSLAISGNATIGGTLGVTGVSSLHGTNISGALAVDNPAGTSITGTGHTGTNYTGVKGIGGSTNGNIGVWGVGTDPGFGGTGLGVVGTGGGSGAGVSGTGGSGDGIGVSGTGGGNGGGVNGVGHGTGVGVQGQTANNSAGVWGAGKNSSLTTELGGLVDTPEHGQNAGTIGTARNVSGDGGYGVIAAGDASGSPNRAALKIVSQQALPANASMGDIMVMGAGPNTGKLYIFNGSSWVIVGTQS